MEQEIVDTLRTTFPNAATIEVSLEQGTGRYNGRLIWSGFDNMPFLDRQKLVFNALRAQFGPEAAHISMIFTYSPSEYEQLVAA